jgi:3'-5' exoribonuclease
VDADLLLTGVILHDIGKIDELTYDRGFGYSDEGQLVGHILIGLRMVDEKARQVPGFPPKLKLLVEHLVASHHGELAYGSPKVPSTLEAMLLHHLDNLDSKVETVRQAVDRDTLVDGNWSAYIPSLERSLLKQDRYLRETPPAAAPAPRNGAERPVSEFAAKLSGALLPKG